MHIHQMIYNSSFTLDFRNQNFSLFESVYVLVCRAVSCKVYLGTHDLYQVRPKLTLSSNLFYEHPYYDPKEIKNDVALVELPEEIDFGGKKIRKAQLCHK